MDTPPPPPVATAPPLKRGVIRQNFVGLDKPMALHNYLLDAGLKFKPQNVDSTIPSPLERGCAGLQGGRGV